MRLSVTSVRLAGAILVGACQSSPGADAPEVVWLCRPRILDDPCAGDLSTTVVDPQGATAVSHLVAATDPASDRATTAAWSGTWQRRRESAS